VQRAAHKVADAQPFSLNRIPQKKRRAGEGRELPCGWPRDDLRDRHRPHRRDPADRAGAPLRL